MDRALCTIFGTFAIELIASERFGRMVAFTGAQFTSVPLEEAVGKIRTVPLEGGFIEAARALGISLGA
jgi:6-phosphofructokinase 1